MNKDTISKEKQAFIDSNRAIISNRLKELRLMKEKSAEKFAYSNDLNRTQYARAEHPDHNISMDYFLLLLSIHEISLVDFFSGMKK